MFKASKQSEFGTRMLRCVLATVFLCYAGAFETTRVTAQQFSYGLPEDIGKGLHKLSGQYCELVTDLPVDDEVRQLPVVFDLAIPQWCEFFEVAIEEVEDWKATIYVISNRELFRELGYFTPELPPVRDGYQAKDRLFVIEQESAYYRRHLVLHEGTHWFMYHAFEGCGSPWYMEGMAEYLGTHEWNNGQLTLGVIPKDRETFPYWGRFKIIRQEYNEKRAPSLRRILNYNNAEHKSVDAYAWSWAAVTFFQSHEDLRDRFTQVRGRKLDYSNLLSELLLAEFEDEWPQIQLRWSAFISNFDYGYQIAALPEIPLKENSETRTNELKLPNEFVVRSELGWQAVEGSVAAGTRLRLECSGQIIFESQKGDDWISEPPGVTLEYVSGYPRAALLCALVPIDNENPLRMNDILVAKAGHVSEIEVQSDSMLLFRVNELPAELSDNSGEYSVQITLQKP